MDFLTDLGKKITETAKTVGKKSEDLVEITKLNLAIGSEEDKIKRLFSEIGSDLYKHYIDGESFGEYFDSKCGELKDMELNIAKIKDKIFQLKGSKVCKSCTELIDLEVKFCPNCGAKAEEQVCECGENDDDEIGCCGCVNCCEEENK